MAPAIPDITDARARFQAACAKLRPELHRFCTRMTGSPCDGEDVLQDALVLAFYRLDELRDEAALRSWLFRIAHNKCIDFLRGRRKHDELDDLADTRAGDDAELGDAFEIHRRVERAVANIVLDLPPKERACVVLKDILEYSLDETAEITGATIGAVKAALHRGRGKLEHAEAASPHAAELAPGDRAVVERYLAAFNRRDWDAVLTLVSADARLEVVERTEGPLRQASYFTNYAALPVPWRLALARVDGVESIVQFRQRDGAWQPCTIVQLAVVDGAIARVRDYVHVDYQLRASIVATVTAD